MKSILYNIIILVAGLTFFIASAGLLYLMCASDLPNWVKFLFGFVVGVFYGIFLMLLTDDIRDFLKRRRDRENG